MTELISTINQIIKYGLDPDLADSDKEKLLERNLVKIYALSFEIEYKFDSKDYPEFDNSLFPHIRQNVASNFKDFGLYKTTLDINDLDKRQRHR